MVTSRASHGVWRVGIRELETSVRAKDETFVYGTIAEGMVC